MDRMISEIQALYESLNQLTYFDKAKKKYVLNHYYICNTLIDLHTLAQDNPIINLVMFQNGIESCGAISNSLPCFHNYPFAHRILRLFAEHTDDQYYEVSNADDVFSVELINKEMLQDVLIQIEIAFTNSTSEISLVVSKLPKQKIEQIDIKLEHYYSIHRRVRNSHNIYYDKSSLESCSVKEIKHDLIDCLKITQD